MNDESQDTTDLIESARDLPLFSALSPAEAERLFTLTRVLWLSLEETLFSEGDEADQLFVVVSGRLRLTCIGAGGVEVEVGTVREGAILGEMGVLDTAPRSATARAMESAVVLALPKAAFEALVSEGHPGARTVLRQISAQVCLRLRTLDHRLDETFEERTEDSPTGQLNLQRLWEALWMER